MSSLDNTNTIEGYFNTIKKRVPLKTATLLDVYKAVTFTEEWALSSNHPNSHLLPATLVECLTSVVSTEVLSVMSATGVRSFLNCFVECIMTVMFNKPQTEDRILGFVFQHLITGEMIDRFRWMPDSWLLSVEEAFPSHEVLKMKIDEVFCPINVVMHLEPYIAIANRSLEVFQMLNDTLSTLKSLKGCVGSQNVIPASYSFFINEYTKFSEAAKENDEVAMVLCELCRSLEEFTFKEENRNVPTRRSIADPKTIKMTGPRTTSTSAKVNRSAPTQRTKMVERYQEDVLDRVKPKEGRKRRHVCSICLETGHHPQTCSRIFDPENAERADVFLKKLIEKNKVMRYLRLLSRRVPSEKVERLTVRVKELSGCPLTDGLFNRAAN